MFNKKSKSNQCGDRQSCTNHDFGLLKPMGETDNSLLPNEASLFSESPIGNKRGNTNGRNRCSEIIY